MNIFLNSKFGLFLQSLKRSVVVGPFTLETWNQATAFSSKISHSSLPNQRKEANFGGLSNENKTLKKMGLIKWSVEIVLTLMSPLLKI